MSTDVLQQSWQIFDKNGTGMITVDEVGEVLRSLGHTPTEKEAKEWAAKVANEEGNVTWEAFHYILQQWQQDDDNTARHMLTEAFRVYDKDETGLIAVNDLRNILTSLGEPLTIDQFEEIVNVLNVDDKGRVKSTNFIEILMKKRT